MKNKVLFIGCNFNQIPYLQNLSNRGFIIIGTDSNDNAPGKKYADKFYNVGYADFKNLQNIIEDESFTKNDLIFTASSQFSYIAASICAKKAQINYPSVNNILKCIDKSKTYPLFEQYEISIPVTQYVNNQEQLLNALEGVDNEATFYLKSDFSKNPNYIYAGTSADILSATINWKKDNFLNLQYVLQDAFKGTGIRINIFEGNFEVYDFETGAKLKSSILDLKPLSGLISKLEKLANEMGMRSWVMKFDIIFNESSYVALDIGLDPPARMKKHWELNNKDFVDFYTSQYVKKF